MAAVEQQCVRLRSLVQACLAKHMYDSAAFYADKLITLSRQAPADIYMLAQVNNWQCFSTREPHFEPFASRCMYLSTMPSTVNGIFGKEAPARLPPSWCLELRFQAVIWLELRYGSPPHSSIA